MILNNDICRVYTDFPKTGHIYIYSILHILTIVFPDTRTVEYQPIFHGVT